MTDNVTTIDHHRAMALDSLNPGGGSEPDDSHRPSGLPTPKNETLTAGGLAVDHGYQRTLKPARVNEIRRHLDLDMLGVVWVSRRANGSLYVLDGQHRVRALVDEGLGDYPLDCKVYEGLTEDQEARVFFWLNKYLRVHAADQFRARARFGDPVAHDIMRVVELHGLELSSTVADGHVVAVVALEAVYTGRVVNRRRESDAYYPEVLSAAIGTLVGAFTKTANGLGGELIKGVGIFWHHYLGTVQPMDVSRKMAIRTGGAVNLLSAARAHAGYEGGTTAKAVAYLMVQDYNKGKSSGKLAFVR